MNNQIEAKFTLWYVDDYLNIQIGIIDSPFIEQLKTFRNNTSTVDKMDELFKWWKENIYEYDK